MTIVDPNKYQAVPFECNPGVNKLAQLRVGMKGGTVSMTKLIDTATGAVIPNCGMREGDSITCRAKQAANGKRDYTLNLCPIYRSPDGK